MHDLIARWRGFDCHGRPYLLPGDDALAGDLVCCFADWDAYISDPNFGSSEHQHHFHLDLLPMPYIGNLDEAKVFVLMVNPGARPHDYFGEYRVDEYRKALIATLRQEPGQVTGLLDTRFAWHGRFRYWHDKLREVIKRIAERNFGGSYGDARQYVSSSVAALELVPYHSTSYKLPARVLDRLESPRLAKAFLHDVLVPRARHDEALILVLRAAKYWGRLPKHRNIVIYGPTEARAAHLTPNSTGGKALLRVLNPAQSA